jgi:hypothetical protein
VSARATARKEIPVRTRRALLIVLVVASLSTLMFGSASAGRDCVTWSVTAPFVGPRGGTRCTADLPSPFTQPFTDDQCGGVPPANTTFCTTVTIYTP